MSKTRFLSHVVREDSPLNMMKRVSCQCFYSFSVMTSYESATKILENLSKRRGMQREFKLETTRETCIQMGMSLDVLDSLSVIHVAGTKGKGSTVSFTESILRHSGLKTGLYTSPHLIDVRERIAVNGRPLTKEIFSKYFWSLWSLLQKKNDLTIHQIGYFQFLTLLAFYVFWKERVDVSLIEVGIGGRFDVTNIVEHPAGVAITALDLDHTSILGTTLKEIAWNKGGVLKDSVTAFIDPEIPSEALEVLFEISRQKKNCQVFLAPPFESYSWEGFPVLLGSGGAEESMKRNASLALQLSRHFLKESHYIPGKGFTLRETERLGLASTFWPGRYQTLVRNKVKYLLDGAHTKLSIELTVKWFASQITANSYKVLVFNVSGQRKGTDFLRILKSLDFNAVIFTTNNITSDSNKYSFLDHDHHEEKEEEKKICRSHKDFWNQGNEILVSSLEDALRAITSLKDSRKDSRELFEVLITGSIHLVGGFLKVLDFDIESRSFLS